MTRKQDRHDSQPAARQRNDDRREEAPRFIDREFGDRLTHVAIVVHDLRHGESLPQHEFKGSGLLEFRDLVDFILL